MLSATSLTVAFCIGRPLRGTIHSALLSSRITHVLVWTNFNKQFGNTWFAGGWETEEREETTYYDAVRHFPACSRLQTVVVNVSDCHVVFKSNQKNNVKTIILPHDNTERRTEPFLMFLVMVVSLVVCLVLCLWHRWAWLRVRAFIVLDSPRSKGWYPSFTFCLMCRQICGTQGNNELELFQNYFVLIPSHLLHCLKFVGCPVYFPFFLPSTFLITEVIPFFPRAAYLVYLE